MPCLIRKRSRGLMRAGLVIAAAALVACAMPTRAQEKRKVIIDQDAAGPGGTDLQSITALVNSPITDVLGITVVTGDQWRDEEVAHTLRMLEIIGRTDIPVVPGAVFPLVNSKEETEEWEAHYGMVRYQGAWNRGNPLHGPWEIPPLPEGAPTTHVANQDAAHFLLRMVHKYPHEVTIYAAGPVTNLALAQAIDYEFASLAKELILMGGSINPVTNDPEFQANPHREFNLWMDPEAARRVLRSPWARIVVTTVDISVKTRMDGAIVAEIAKGKSASAEYVAKYARESYLWDELAAVAWLDPSIITRTTKMHMDVSIDHGPTYGDTIVWEAGKQPPIVVGQTGPVEVQEDLDKEKFYKELVELLTRGMPGARPGASNRTLFREMVDDKRDGQADADHVREDGDDVGGEQENGAKYTGGA